MNYQTYYNSKGNNLYSYYINNYADSINPKQNRNNIEDKNTKYISNIYINKGFINKNKISYNNKNNKKMDNLIYKSVLEEVENNSFKVKNSSKNKDLYLYQTYNDKTNKYSNNINIKNNIHDNNNYLSNKSNHKLLSQSINKYNNINDNKISIKNKYNNISVNSLNKNSFRQFYSSPDSFYNDYYDKNIYNNLNTKIENNSNQNEILEDLIDDNNEIFMDKSEFFKGVKEIQDLDSVDVESSHAIIDMDENTNTKMFNNIENKFIHLSNNDSIRNSLNLFKQTTYNPPINLSSKNKLNTEKKEGNNFNYNKINLKNKINSNNILKGKITTEKKNKIKFTKKISEKIISNLTDNKRNNYLNNLNFNDTFSNSNIKRENLKNFNYEFDFENYNSFNDNNNLNSNNNILVNKFSSKLNILPYNQKRFSTLTNNDDIPIDKMNLDNSEDEEIFEDKNLYGRDYNDIYNELINTKKINNELNKKIIMFKKIINNQKQTIKKMFTENIKNTNWINNLMKENQVKLNTNKNLVNQIAKLNNELNSLKNREEEHVNKNLSFKMNNGNKYIKEIKELKEKINKYEIENNKLKILLIKSKEKQYSNDVSRKNYINTFVNYSQKNNNIINFRGYNKSVSVSRTKNNIDKSISKTYKEDKDIKSQYENNINIKVIKHQ